RLLGFVFACILSSSVGVISAPFLYVLGAHGYTNYLVGKTMAVVGPLVTGIRVNLVGKANLKKENPCVYVCNHQSALDLIAMGHVIRPNVVVMAKSSIKYVPIMGQFMQLARNILIDRKNRSSALEMMAQAAKYLQQNKAGLFVFPEGTRSHQKDNSMLPFKKGAFHVAVQGEIPIVPIVVSTYYPCYDEKEKILEPGVVTIK
ncbi:hypothetical protein BDK51DRAFT_12331, partial [Blyttiomyces helicus]